MLPSSERSGYQPPKVDEIDPYFFKDPFWIRGTALKRILKWESKTCFSCPCLQCTLHCRAPEFLFEKQGIGSIPDVFTVYHDRNHILPNGYGSELDTKNGTSKSTMQHIWSLSGYLLDPSWNTSWILNSCVTRAQSHPPWGVKQLSCRPGGCDPQSRQADHFNCVDLWGKTDHFCCIFVYSIYIHIDMILLLFMGVFLVSVSDWLPRYWLTTGIVRWKSAKNCHRCEPIGYYIPQFWAKPVRRDAMVYFGVTDWSLFN